MARLLSCLGHCPAHQKVADSIPSQGMRVWEAANYVPLSFSQPPTLLSSASKVNKTALTGVTHLVGHHSQCERFPVSFSVRAHATDAGLVPIKGVCEKQPIDVSLPLLLPPFTSA